MSKSASSRRRFLKKKQGEWGSALGVSAWSSGRYLRGDSIINQMQNRGVSDQSGRHWFLAGGTELVDPQVVADALLVEEVRAGQVGAHRTAGELLVAGQATAQPNGYISCSPPSNSMEQSESMADCGSPLYFCTLSIHWFISSSSSPSFSISMHAYSPPRSSPTAPSTPARNATAPCPAPGSAPPAAAPPPPAWRSTPPSICSCSAARSAASSGAPPAATRATLRFLNTAVHLGLAQRFHCHQLSNQEKNIQTYTRTMQTYNWGRKGGGGLLWQGVAGGCPYYIMNKCEHGQKIGTFCASECCVWREAGGCEGCMKKYHNHMGPTIFLSEEDVLAMVKKYTVDSTHRPKCRMLQEAVYSYFNLLKTEITASIDTVCKNTVSQIGYPFLYCNSTLSTYKRLKNKEYKKLQQKDFRNLYEHSLRVNEEQLVAQEIRIYGETVKKTQELLNGLEDAVREYETAIKKAMGSFTHDRNYFVRIQEILKAINGESQAKQAKIKDNKDNEARPEIVISLPKEKVSPKAKNEAAVNNENAPLRIPMISISPPPLLTKPNYSKNVSIDKKLVGQHPFNSSKLREKSRQLSRKEENKQSDSKSYGAQKLNNREIQINEKKKMLMEMMNVKTVKQKSNIELAEKKQSQTSKISLGIPSFFKREYLQKSPSKNKQEEEKSHEVDLNVKQLTYQSDENSHNDIDQEQNGSKIDNNYVEQQAFTQLPLLDQDLAEAHDIELVKQKVIVVSHPKELQDLGPNFERSNSPILKKKNLQTSRQRDEEKQQSEESKVKQEETVSSLEQALQLKENQEKSLALLLKSLTLNAQEAIKYLQGSLHQAENNLSAAEYLSFLYLQQDKPQLCLHLCNKMLEKLQNSAQSDELSLLLSNNKAAALNVLGRYSQSIVILQKCLKSNQKDYLFKNLADAYFSISIYEKAIYNYEMALKLNEGYDQAQYNLSVCLYIQENYFNAKLAIKKALLVHPDNAKYLQLLFHIQTRITHC